MKVFTSKLQFSTRPITIGIIFVTSFLLVLFKGYLLFAHTRYLAYGYDTTRVISYANYLIRFHTFDRLSMFRFGLPLFTVLLSKLTQANAFHVFDLPFWFFVLTPLISIGLITHELTHNKFQAAISMLFFALLFIPDPPNDSSFASLVLVPLKCFTLINVFSKKSSFKSIWVMASIFLTFALTFSYPIFAYIVDIIVATSFLFAPKIYKKYVIIQLLSQIAAIFALYFFGSFLERSLMPYPLFTLRALNLAVLPNTVGVGLAAYPFKLLFELAVTIFTLVGMKNFSLTSFFCKISIPSKLILSLGLILCSYDLYQRILVYKLDFVNHPLAVIPAGIFITSMVISLIILKTPKLPVVTYIFGTITIIFGLSLFFPIHIPYFYSIVSNSRTQTLLMPLTAVVLSSFISLKRSFTKLVLISLLIVGLQTIIFSATAFRSTLEPSTQKAAQWLINQPNNDWILYTAHYVREGRTVYHEKYKIETFVPTKIPLSVSQTLNLCDLLAEYCFYGYKQFVTNYSVNYLVIEEDDHSYLTSLLTSLGEVVYNDNAIIIKINKTN